MKQAFLRAIILTFALTYLGFDRAMAEDRIWINATINGHSAHLYFDTGASGIKLLSKSASRLGLMFAPPPDFTPDPFRIPFTKTAMCDFEFEGQKVKTDFLVLKAPDALFTEEDGWVGWQSELFANKIVSIDSRLATVKMLSNLPAETAKWKAWHIRTNSCILALESSDRPTSFVNLDTGSPAGVMLSPKRWRAWRDSHPNRVRTLNAYYAKGAGLIVAEEAWASEIAIGKLALENVPVMEANQADVAMSGAGFEATLGLAALKHLDLFVDGKQFVAYTKPSHIPIDPYVHNCLGAAFTPVDLLTLRGEILIAHVAPGSPAFLAGIRDGDQLLKYNDLEMKGWQTNATLIPSFQGSSNMPPVHLTLKRGTNTFTLNVTPKPILASNPKTLRSNQ